MKMKGYDKMMRIGYFVFILATTLFLEISYAADMAANKVVAKVNGVEITQLEVESELHRLIPRSFFHQSVDKNKMEILREDALNNLIEKELKIQEAQRLGLNVPDRELIKGLEKIIAGYPDRKTFEEQLKAGGNTIKDAKNEIRRRKLAEMAYQNQVVDKVHVSENDAETYYHENKEKFVQPFRYRLKNILLKIPPLANDSDRTTIREKAEMIVQKIKEGLPFEKAVQEYSEDSNKERDGDMRPLHQGEFNPEIEKEILALNPGEIAGPFQTFKGYYIFRMEEILPARLSPFEEIKDQLISNLTAMAMEEREKIWLEGLNSKAKIIIMKK